MKREKVNKKQLAAAAFAVFFLIMAVCTAVSRAAASMVVPKVTTGKVQEGKLSILIQGKGTVETREESLLSLQTGLRVEKILQTGTVVKKGDVLLQYDQNYLQERIEEKQAEIKKLELAVEQAKLTGQPQARVEAAESAQRDVQLSEDNYAKAWEDYNAAAEAYETGAAGQQQNLDQELQAAEEEKERVLQQAQELEAAGEAEEAEKLRQQAEENAEQRKAQAQSAYDSAIQELELQKSQAEESLQAQDSARAQAYNAYESAKEQDAAAAENDKKTAEAGSYTTQSAQVDLELAKKELEKLQKVQSENGEVKAPEDGVLKSSTIAAGGVTDDTASLMFGWGGYRVKGNLTAEDLSKAETGDEVKIMVPGQGKTLKKNIGEISGNTNQQGEGQTAAGVFYAEMEEKEAVYGSEISYEISRQTDSSYKQVIPLSAVRKDSDGTFCLVAEEEKTVLGNEYRAKRVAVTVVEKDSTSAAITASLGQEDKIITGSSKDIAPEDKVRLEE
ncbi:hypothetical protein WBS51_10905 [Blautia sp. HA2174]|uniref:hypothetical protein n=1 Tax=unclassified Blautia TaxID=2648079 RepID=UPI0025CC2645|nr:hypothetical protein [uncultured Blautia sp.]